MLYSRTGTFHLAIATLVCSCHLVSCRTGKHNDTRIDKLPPMDLVAWNEDTIKTIKIGFDKGNTFYYLLQENSSKEAAKNLYKGTWQRLGDTLLLTYKNGKKPDTFKPFLIIEMTRHYLIQEIDPNRNRFYLRINQSIDEARGFHPPRPWEKK